MMEKNKAKYSIKINKFDYFFKTLKSCMIYFNVLTRKHIKKFQTLMKVRLEDCLKILKL